MNILQQTEQKPAVSCESLLTKAIQLYGEIGQLYLALPKSLTSSSARELSSKISAINSLYLQAQTLDSLAIDALEADPELEQKVSGLLEKRAAAIHRLISANASLVHKAHNVKSAVQNELSLLTTSHNALHSYKKLHIPERSYLNHSF